MTADSGSLLCPDWIFLNNSNVHVAKDRGWFKTYTPFESKINSSPFTSPSNHSPVLGIGTVEIPTKRSPNLSGKPSHGSLQLKEVLHVPEALCNIIGQPIASSDGYRVEMSFGEKSNGSIKDGQGKNIAYFDPNSPLFAIKVKDLPTGPKLGPHVLRKGGMYMISCRWDSTEKQKWEEFKLRNGLTSSVSEPAGTAGTSLPYTNEEKAFLKSNYGSEFHFLQIHGLNIHKEEHREEGRQILRTLMVEDASEDELNEEASEESEDEMFDFAGHQADYNFTHSQLEWIGKHYGNSENFMICFGLKFYKDEDLDEAKRIAEIMMNDD